MTTVRMRIDVFASEKTIETVMARRECSRKMALEEIRCAWEIETENMEPVLEEGADMIVFQSGGAE